jgi:hypothetical protein
VRIRRLLKRLLIVALVLAAIGVAAFTWFFYWPLEGSVARVEDLVPAEVDFVYRANWAEIRRTGWVDRNVLETPIHPALEARPVIDSLLSELQRMFDQVNASIPVAFLRLDLERDFLSGDVIAAGRYCGGTNPKDGPPQWREILGVVRLSSRAKMDVAALRHSFIREQSGPDAAIEERAGYLRVTVRTIVPSDRRKRGGCEGGYERPPENLWYVARVKDVLAVTNSEDLVEKVVALGRGEGARAVDRPGFELKPTDGGISAVVDIVPLRSYLNRALAGPDAQRFAAFLGRFTTIEALDRMNATLEPEGPDGLIATADIRHVPSDLHPAVKEAYAKPPRAFADGIARIVPEKDTVAVVQLETPPLNLLSALYDFLPPDDRALWDNNIRQIGNERAKEGKTGYGGIQEFFAELAGKLDTTTGIAVARLSSVYDHVRYADWFSNEDPQPMSVGAVVVHVREAIGSTPEERRKNVDEFLSDRAALLGFAPPEPATRDGIPYSRLNLRIQVRDLENVKPAYLVFEDRLIIATHEDYLFAILDTMRGGASAPTSVAASETFRATTAPLAKDVTVGIYVNVAEAQKQLWDYRNRWVQREHPDDRHAIEYRARLRSTYQSRGPVGEAEEAKINDEVDREVERYRVEEYPRFLEERRRQIDDLGRLRSGAITLVAGGDVVLRGGAVVLLNPRDKLPSPP